MLNRPIIAAGLGMWLLSSIPANAQRAPSVILDTPSPLTAIAGYATAPEIKAAIARARREIKPGAALILQPLLKFAPYTAFLEYRRGPWTAAVHTDIELFVAVEGSGTLVSGGTFLPGQPAGSGIDGGQMRTVRAGDVFVIPQGTPHMFSAIDGELIMISMHIPSGSAAPRP